MALPFLALALIIVGFPCDIYLGRRAPWPAPDGRGKIVVSGMHESFIYVFFSPK